MSTQSVSVGANSMLYKATLQIATEKGERIQLKALHWLHTSRVCVCVYLHAYLHYVDFSHLETSRNFTWNLIHYKFDTSIPSRLLCLTYRLLRFHFLFHISIFDVRFIWEHVPIYSLGYYSCNVCVLVFSFSLSAFLACMFLVPLTSIAAWLLRDQFRMGFKTHQISSLHRHRHRHAAHTKDLVHEHSSTLTWNVNNSNVKLSLSMRATVISLVLPVSLCVATHHSSKP